jgi:DNA-directed RNA polymerase sigma subunit (sigma70/sigma32)
MTLMDDLLEERASATLELDRVKNEISNEKARIAQKRAEEKESIGEGRSSIKVRLLESENARLRGLLSVYIKSSGLTFDRVGAILGVTKERARQIIDEQKRRMRL